MTKILGLSQVMSFKLFTNNRSAEQEKRKCINKYSCYTQRQWTLLYSVLLLIWTAMVTTLAILGFIKTEYGFKLAKLDIEEELNKSSKSHAHEEINNEILLCSSMRFNLMTACALYLSSWMGILNLFAELLLLYGILIRSFTYVVPWIVISAASVVMSAVTATVLSFNQPIAEKSCDLFTANIFYTICVLTFCLLMVYGYFTTLKYCKSLKQTSGKNTSNGTTTVKAYGGYTHTLKPADQPEKKQLI